MSIAFLRTGHVATCPTVLDPQAACLGTCESKLFNFTGIFAGIAAIFEVTIGLLSGSSFTAGNAVHGGTDCFTDFYGANVAKKIPHLSENEEVLVRKRTSHVIALALLVATIPISIELIFGADHQIIPEGMMLAGSLTLLIHLFRWHLFRQAHKRDPKRTRMDLIRHVRTDSVHASIVLCTGSIFKVAEIFSVEVLFGFTIVVQLTWGGLLWEATPENIDFVLTLGLIGYMLVQAWLINSGKGHVHLHENENHHH